MWRGDSGESREQPGRRGAEAQSTLTGTARAGRASIAYDIYCNTPSEYQSLDAVPQYRRVEVYQKAYFNARMTEVCEELCVMNIGEMVNSLYVHDDAVLD